MPNKRSADKQAVTVFLEKDLVAAVKAATAARGETVTAVVERALAEYAGFTRPPPALGQQTGT
jgi:hypothetical protein